MNSSPPRTRPFSWPDRRTVLTVAVGQEGGRLRVHRLRLGPVGHRAEGGNKLVFLS
jgi:hypothetical protein